MSKKKLNLTAKTVDGNIKAFVFSNGFKIYPVSELEINYLRRSKSVPSYVAKPVMWYIEVEHLGKRKLFNKKILNKEINDALDKVYLHYYKQLKGIKDE